MKALLSIGEHAQVVSTSFNQHCDECSGHVVRTENECYCSECGLVYGDLLDTLPPIDDALSFSHGKPYRPGDGLDITHIRNINRDCYGNCLSPKNLRDAHRLKSQQMNVYRRGYKKSKAIRGNLELGKNYIKQWTDMLGFGCSVSDKALEM